LLIIWTKILQKRKIIPPTQSILGYEHHYNYSEQSTGKNPKYKETNGRTFAAANSLRRLKTALIRRNLIIPQNSGSIEFCLWSAKSPIWVARARAIWRSTRAVSTSRFPVTSTTMGTKETPCEAQAWTVSRWAPFYRAYASAKILPCCWPNQLYRAAGALTKPNTTGQPF
jgi:hypothetical protein